MSFPLVWIISGLLFAVLLISLGFQPKILNRLLGAIFLFVGVSGLLFYGFGSVTALEAEERLQRLKTAKKTAGGSVLLTQTVGKTAPGRLFLPADHLIFFQQACGKAR